MEDFKEPQAINDEQYFQELRQRINAKAEKLAKIKLIAEKKRRWLAITLIAICIAILVALGVYSYVNHVFWAFIAFLGAFLGVSFIVYYIMTLVMRNFFTRMKNASTAPQYYREVKRLITTHKLRQWIPLVFAIVCASFVKYGNDSWPYSFLMGSAMVIGTIWGASMRNWFLDEDFCSDVEELKDLVNQERAA